MRAGLENRLVSTCSSEEHEDNAAGLIPESEFLQRVLTSLVLASPTVRDGPLGKTQEEPFGNPDHDLKPF